ncbi:MAG TPA: M20/M25/M40 family metallo-hydrolase [Ktedonobacteraceae bacterium]|nr:M20/M25/M40 family metallo-hydrolase [Ktedonobacteraceae bacterium]
MTETAVNSYLETHPDEARELLELLTRQPSVAAQGLGMAEMAALVEKLLQETGFSTRRLDVEGAPTAIYGELRGRSPYTVLLYNHYDVQPAEPLELWNTPPFEPTVREGKLYARGSSDNKGEIAARLAAMRALLATNSELPITLRWIIEGEEEVGSPHFAAIAERYAPLLKADASFWEGSHFGPTGRPELLLGTKGLLYVQLEAEGAGTDAHSGSAPILPSPAWRLVHALASLKTPQGRVLISGFYEDVLPPSQQQLAAIADQPNMDAELRAAYRVDHFVDNLSGAALRERLAFAPTCNIAGLLSGYTGSGVKTVLPSKAMAKIDFRLVPNQEPQDITAKLRAYLDAQGYSDISLTVLGAAEPVVTPMEEPIVQQVMKIARQYSGQKPVINPIGGGTLPLLGALRRFVGVPGLAVPGNPTYWANGAHAPNEHIRLADLQQAVRFNCYLFSSLGQE